MSVQAMALDAVQHRARGRRLQKRPVMLAPVTPVIGTWQTPVAMDPLEVPIEEKIALLLTATKPRSASRRALRQQLARAPARGEDARHDRRHLHGADFIGSARSSRPPGRHRRFPELLPRDRTRGAGWEYATGLDLVRHAPVGIACGRETLCAQRGPGSGISSSIPTICG